MTNCRTFKTKNKPRKRQSLSKIQTATMSRLYMLLMIYFLLTIPPIHGTDDLPGPTPAPGPSSGPGPRSLTVTAFHSTKIPKEAWPMMIYKVRKQHFKKSLSKLYGKLHRFDADTICLLLESPNSIGRHGLAKLWHPLPR
jgi:hypothetical protein